MDGIVALIKSKKYTEESLIGLGALRGANCTIKSYLDNLDGTHTIIFEWTGTDNTKQTNTMIVKDGNDGVSISSVVIDGDNHLICTMSDGSIQDAGLIADIGGSGADSVLEEDVRVTGTSLGAIEDGTTIPRGTSFTQLVKMATSRVIHPTYNSPTLNLSTNNLVFERNTNYNAVITPSYSQRDGGSIYSVVWSKNGVAEPSVAIIDSKTYTITDTTSFSLTVGFSNGEIKRNNLGELDDRGSIKAGSISKSVTFTGVIPYYYGTLSTSTVDSLNGLTKQITTKENKEYSFSGTNVYSVILYDSTYGVLNSILDQNGFNVTGGFNTGTVEIDGTTYRYYITTTSATLSGFKYNFKY